LDRWAENLPDRRIVECFLEWCSERRIELCVWNDDARWPRPVLGGANVLLDQYHEIDRQQLERERRVLQEEP